MSRTYSFNSYDKYLSLKAGSGLWLVILYLLHPYILLLSSAGLGRARSGGGGVGIEGFRHLIYPSDFSLAVAIVATFPALVFVYAWARRKPGASPLVQAIWRRGLWLLVATGALNIGSVFVPLLTEHVLSIHANAWMQIGVSSVVIVYLLFSKRVRDTFADFPAEAEPSRRRPETLREGK
jgi:hypothetical protein